MHPIHYEPYDGLAYSGDNSQVQPECTIRAISSSVKTQAGILAY